MSARDGRRGNAITAGWEGASVARAIYGLIVALSVLAVWSAKEDPDGTHVLVSVIASAIVFWLAHVYSEVLEKRIHEGRPATRAEVRGVLRHEWPLVEVAVLPTLAILLGVLDVVAVTTAVSIAFYLALAELVAVGALSAWRAGTRGLTFVLYASMSVGLGLAIVALKSLLH